MKWNHSRWRFSSQQVGRLVGKIGRRLLGLIFGAIAGFWCADILLLSGDEPQAPPTKTKVAVAEFAEEPLATFSKFPDWVSSVAFNPDGGTLAAGSYGTTKLFDIATKKEMTALAEKAGMVKSVAFSPDGKRIAVGSYQSVSLWDADSKQLAKTLKGHRGYVTATVFSADSKLLATSSEDETVRLWDAATGESRATLTGHTQPVTCVAFSVDGKQLASCSGDVTRPTQKGEAKLWDVATGSAIKTWDAHDRALTSVAFSPDGTLLATASFDEKIKLWELATGKELKVLDGHSRPVNSVAFLPDGKWIASAAGGRFVGKNEVRIWDVATGKQVTTLTEHEGPIQQLALSRDGKRLATASLDKTVQVWDLSPRTVVLANGGDKANATPSTPFAKLAKLAEAQLKDAEPQVAAVKELRGGIIGLDTSHVTAFSKVLNDTTAKDHLPGCRIVAAYPKGSPDIESSTKRVPEYTEAVKKLGVEIVDSIDSLLTKVDVVFLETNDGRPHLEQVLPVLKAGKPVFIDKPIAGSLADAVAIFDAANQYKVPLFSSSSLRFYPNTQAIRGGKIGEILGCDAFSPCSLESTHPDLFWYGIHGVETLFTIMGPGCESVSRTSTPDFDVAVGTWKGGRIGTFRGNRKGSGYGGTAFGTKGTDAIGSAGGGYRPLLVEIVKFFQTGTPPVTQEETLEIYAFMEAADESKRQGGKPVTLESVLAKARAAKAKK